LVKGLATLGTLKGGREWVVMFNKGKLPLLKADSVAIKEVFFACPGEESLKGLVLV